MGVSILRGSRRERIEIKEIIKSSLLDEKTRTEVASKYSVERLLGVSSYSMK